MKKLILCLLIALSASAQKNNNIWYFGRTGAGLNFNTCPPTVLINGWNGNFSDALFEGSASMSDALGNLLFYTNGLSIFAANHVWMQNGLNIGPGNTMSQNIIIPKPGSASLYYVFMPQIQAGAWAGSGIVVYATVDMSMNAGMGSVTNPGIILRDTIGRRGTEKLTAVKHANGTDIWLIGHDYFNNKFFAYLISTSGINPVPVETSVGPVINQIGNTSNTPSMGELKASPDGSKLCFTCGGNGLTALFQFDNATGIVSNPITLDIDGGGLQHYGYGVSFSPDNSKVYVNSQILISYPPSYFHYRIFQFDLSTWNTTSIQNSRFDVAGAISTEAYYSMKLGPDKKIYVAKFPSQFVSVIGSPNLSGAACNFTDNAINMGLPVTWGLNNAMELFDTQSSGTLTVSATSPTICSGSSVILTASGSSSYSWQPAGNFTGSGSASIAVTPTSATIYSVISTSTQSCIPGSTFLVMVNPLPTLSLSASQPTVCKGNKITVTASGASTYTWNNTPTSSPTLTPTLLSTTTYTVKGTDQNGCKNETSLQVVVSPCTGISELNESKGPEIYPNPSNGEFVLTCNENAQLRIYNQSGEEVLNTYSNKGTNIIKLDSDLADGIYLVRVVSENGTITYRRILVSN